MSSRLYEVFQETARRQPQQPAILGPGNTSITYAQLDQAIRETAARLRHFGVHEGDCAGLHFASGTDYIVLTYALWSCGACVVPIATELAAAEKAGVLQEIAVDHLVSDGGKAAFADPYRRGEQVSVSEAAAISAIASPCLRPIEYDSIDAAFIRFTSGTTGSSKGVVLSHATVLDRIAAANEVLHIGPKDRVLWLLSMAYHFTVSIVSYLTHGAAIVLPDNHFAEAVVTACRRRGATLMYASPAHWALLADYRDAAPIDTLRLAVSTTTSLEHETAEKFHRQYGLPLSQALGIIEIGLPCINVDFAATKCDSVGRVLPAYELRLDDVGLDGNLRRILFRGKGMLDAYYRPWRPRDQILSDGWFDTGDIGELDADGCLLVRGRSKDVISVMGVKYFPQEVEAVLMAHPAVAAAGVFAEHDRRRGDVPYARVVCRPDMERAGLEQELRTWCRRRLAFYKVPQAIKIVDDLPRTASGKILHRQAEGASR
jgi:long-chain acyl-CoA synthetase